MINTIVLAAARIIIKNILSFLLANNLFQFYRNESLHPKSSFYELFYVKW